MGLVSITHVNGLDSAMHEGLNCGMCVVYLGELSYRARTCEGSGTLLYPTTRRHFHRLPFVCLSYYDVLRCLEKSSGLLVAI